MKYCDSCAQTGPYGCDTCELGYFFDTHDERCSDCDTFRAVNSCKHCLGLNKCTECNEGFRLAEVGSPDEGRCLSCDDSSCASCIESAGVCEKCQPGFWLNGATCKPCSGHCTSCISDTVCSTCDQRVSRFNETSKTCECHT